MPWFDGYKPKLDEIEDQIQIFLAPISEEVKLTALPPCGWIGICADETCNFYDVSPVEVDF